MKKRILALLVVFLFAGPATIRAEFDEDGGLARNEVIKVKILKPIIIGTTNETEAEFQNLKPKALQIGMNNAKIIGKISFADMPNKNKRVVIEWHTLNLPSGNNNSINETLQKKLRSQFITNEERVEPETILSAKGDLEALTEKYLALKAKVKMETGGTNVAINDGDEAASEETDKSREDAYSPAASTGYSGSGDSSGTIDMNDGVETELVTTTWEVCSPRIVPEESKIYIRKKPVDKNQDGELVNEGPCADTGESVDAQKRYEGDCPNIVDFEARKVYQQYIEYGVVEGTEILINSCQMDTAKDYEVLSNVIDCGYRHDFNTNVSIEQEILYYNNNGSVEELTECQDSSQAYAHFETDQTCTATIDYANSLVFENWRVAFTVDGSTVEFASECRPKTGDTGKAISFENCDPKYEHDFVNNASYKVTKPYYLDGSGQTVYLGSCSRDTSVSFAHKYDSTDCAIINDDDNLQSTFQSTTFIDTTEDGIIEIASCQAEGSPVLYVQQAGPAEELSITSSQDFTVPYGVTTLTTAIWGGGGGGGGGGNVAASGLGGGGGGYKGDLQQDNVFTSPGTVIAVVIGSGGSGGGTEVSGGNGGNSTFGGYLLATGGTGGTKAVGMAGGAGAGKGGGGHWWDEGGYNVTAATDGGTASAYFSPVTSSSQSGGSGGSGGGGYAYCGGGGGGGGGGAKGAGGSGGDCTAGTGAAGGNAAANSGAGAGGGGGGGSNYKSAGGGSGGSGGALVKWTGIQYLRGDGTIYVP